MVGKRNIYIYDIDLQKLFIPNAPRLEFTKHLEKAPYRGYEVEGIVDGRKIVIAKPGGKQAYGRMKKEDFFVFIYNPEKNSFWQISHKQIYEDLKEKSKISAENTINILKALKRVYNGEDPNQILEDADLKNLSGESPEVLLKAYKWIWGQEDVNYPAGKGRAMSWEGWKKIENN